MPDSDLKPDPRASHTVLLTEEILHMQANLDFALKQVEHEKRACRQARERARHFRRLATDAMQERDTIRLSWSWLLTHPLRWAVSPLIRPVPARPRPLQAAAPSEEFQQADLMPYDPHTLVSIAIPVHNGASYLAETLTAVCQQTHPALEIVIVDDNSTDASMEIAESFRARNPRIRLIYNDHNLGMIANWNKAVSACNGEWIQVIGQDDLLDPDAIETAMRKVRRGIRIILACRNFTFENDVGDALRDTYRFDLPTLESLGVPAGIVTPQMIVNQIRDLLDPCTNFLGEPLCGLVRRDVFSTYGLFHTDLSQLGDYEFWLRCFLNEPFVFLHDRICTFRVHGNSATSANMATPVRGIHLESARLLLLLIEAPAFKEARRQYPDLVPLWEAQLAYVIMALRTYVKRDPEAAHMIQAACQKYPTLERHVYNPSSLERLRSLRLRFRHLFLILPHHLARTLRIHWTRP